MCRSDIVITSQNFRELNQLLRSIKEGEFPEKALLEAELDRALIVASNEIPMNIVTMNSRVRFQLRPFRRALTRTLVYPKDLNGNWARLSIFTTLGSALLGLSTGARITWPHRAGGSVGLIVEQVEYQPEHAEFSRQ